MKRSKPSAQEVPEMRQRCTCLHDAETGKPIMLPVQPKKKRYGMTTMFGIRTRDRDWGKAGRDAARRVMKAYGVKPRMRTTRGGSLKSVGVLLASKWERKGRFLLREADKSSSWISDTAFRSSGAARIQCAKELREAIRKQPTAGTDQ